MSKKTRKKSKAASPAKGVRAGPKKTTKKPVSTTRQRPASKSAKTTGKTTGKTTAKTPVKAAAKKAAKEAVKKAAKGAAKAPVKAQPKTARKAMSGKPSNVRGDVRTKTSAAETAETKAEAATVATVAPAAMEPAASTPDAMEPAAATPAATEPAAAPAAILSHETASHQIAATEGGPAPRFELPRDGGEHVSLADYVGQKLVIFFYPRADTPGCTREAIDFTRLKGDFAAAGTAVLGVSADPIKTQESFRDKHQLLIPLVSDETHEMLDAYGAWGEKTMYGRTFQGVLRTTVLIDADGRIARIWRGVKVDGHADAVLAAAREL